MKKYINYILCFLIIFVIYLSSYNNMSIASDNNEILQIKFEDTNMYNKIVESLQDISISKDDKEKAIYINSYDLNKITILELNNEEIKDITGIEYFTNLEYLNLSNNNISDISEISKLTNLKKLYIYGCAITDISQLNSLENLEELNISKNKLEDTSSNHIINQINNLHNLKVLDISHNYLKYTDGLENFANLVDLNLYDNRIQDLSGIATLVNLEELNLGENNENSSITISNIEVLNNLVKLKSLNFSENNIPDIINNISSLTNLEALQLEKNNLINISNISYLTNLKEINLYNNKIEDISPIAKLTNLENVIISKNKISDISCIYNNSKLVWNNLKKIDIASNNLTLSDTIEYLCNESINENIELNYENIVDTSNLPHYDNDGTAYVTYDDFGARCNGEYDDFIAIRNAHNYANYHKCEVRATSRKNLPYF